MSKEAMKLALEALEELTTSLRTMDDIERGERAIAALREALAEQEPTAWRYLTHYKNQSVWTYCAFEPTSRMRWEALYTSPPQRTWVGLTIGEIQDLIQFKEHSPFALAEDIEAKLKEKNT